MSQQNGIDMLIMVGDIAYPDEAYMYGSDYEQSYDDFMTALEPLSSTIPLMVASGNHEAGAYMYGRGYSA